MNGSNLDLYETRMDASGQQTWFPENHHYVPDTAWTRSCFTVLRAGKAVTAREHRIQREAYQGQDILFCASGRGFATTEGKTLNVVQGQLVWIANERPHAHWPDLRDPWSVFFVRIDGPDCTAMRRKVFGSGAPLTLTARATEIESWFKRLFETLRNRDHNIDLTLNHLVAEMFCMLVSPSTQSREARLPRSLHNIMAKMREAPERQWQSDELSSIAGLSAAQVRRLFNKHLQVSPRDWLTRERIMLAQKLLLDGVDITNIADRCGFCDIYHFSREFKRRTGASPRKWRQMEGASMTRVDSSPS